MDNRFLFPLPLVLQTFAAYAFCLLLYLHLRQYRLRSPRWGGWAWRVLALALAVVYVCDLTSSVALLVSDGFVAEQPGVCALLVQAALLLIGPLLMQLFYTTERDRLPRPALWAAFVGTSWAAAAWLSAGILGDMEYANDTTESWPYGANLLLGASGLFACVVVLVSRRPHDSAFRRNLDRWRLALACALEVLLLSRGAWSPALQSLAFGHLPVAFMLVTVYYGERFVFWDVFAKRGLFFSAALLALTGHIALLGHFLDLTILEFARSWVFSLSLLPLVAAAPWAHSHLNRLIDRAVLGREYAPVDAVRHFAQSLQASASGKELVARAEASAGEIFRSEARLEQDCEPGDREGIATNIDVDGSRWGLLRVLPRADEIPFLSEDLQLLSLLSRMLGIALENEGLRNHKVRQQQREHELALAAVRSELKALRAQINPHFLFNALNTVAALIPRQPDRAEQVVEQLSDVFRHAVRHSEREWVHLDEEALVVSAYLDIERARFGERLDVKIAIDDRVRQLQIPAMVVLTLAENAIKHGVAAMRGPARIAICMGLHGDSLHIRVQDSGPGFPPGVTPETLPEPSRSGYGLRNVRERLGSYFGPEARMAFGRSEGWTEVALWIPLRREAAAHACAHRG